MPWFKAPGGAHASHLTLTRAATLVLAQALALGLIGAGNAVAAPVLRCEIEANNTMHRFLDRLPPEPFWCNKRVIVTGGAGFLGSFVVEKLQRRGAKEVIVPRRRVLCTSRWELTLDFAPGATWT